MSGRFLTWMMVAATALGAQAPRRVELVVTSTTDVHNRLRAWDYYGNAAEPQRGLSRAATVVDSVRAAHPGRVILVDAGDLLQGSPLGYVAARLDTIGVHPVIAAMNAMRYDAAAIGNHEFNYGIPTLRKALKDATFPFLGANVVHLGRERARPLVVPSRIVVREGIRVAIVGATTPGSMVWDRQNLAGRLRMTDVVTAVRREVAAVRRRGADVVTVVMHTGLSGETSYDTTGGLPPENVAADVAMRVPGIDLIVFGHSHREVADTTINGVMLQQPRNWAQSVGAATLTVERRGGRWRVVEK
ncbi:MAG: metallophosphoesterase, partial [Gemmatimonadetes bacterium]|nr:metallophosphoesterase [Gemmatimonadota bacterium]